MDRKVKLRVSDWNNGIWGNIEYFFDSVENAKKKAKKLKKPCKFYNHKGWLIGKHNPHCNCEDDDNDGEYN